MEKIQPARRRWEVGGFMMREIIVLPRQAGGGVDNHADRREWSTAFLTVDSKTFQRLEIGRQNVTLDALEQVLRRLKVGSREVFRD